MQAAARLGIELEDQAAAEGSDGVEVPLLRLGQAGEQMLFKVLLRQLGPHLRCGPNDRVFPHLRAIRAAFGKGGIFRITDSENG